MPPTIETDKGWTEATLDDNCDADAFYAVAGVLETYFNAEFSGRAADLDSIYWDFEYHDHKLTLHYNIYFGVCIFPKAMKAATPEDNKAVEEIATRLMNKMTEIILEERKREHSGRHADEGGESPHAG